MTLLDNKLRIDYKGCKVQSKNASKKEEEENTKQREQSEKIILKHKVLDR